jgi:hypothetical protein
MLRYFFGRNRGFFGGNATFFGRNRGFFGGNQRKSEENLFY